MSDGISIDSATVDSIIVKYQGLSSFDAPLSEPLILVRWRSLFSERDASRWQRLRFALTERESSVGHLLD